MLMMKKKIMNTINNSLLKLPVPMFISTWWTIGSLLGLCLMIQILTGLLLCMYYTNNINWAYDSVNYMINRNSMYGWMIQSFHINGASMMFICLYLHMGRGLYYMSYNLKSTWNIGVTMFIMTMMTAFLGYVLPWGQMSYWGATVITSLMTETPYIGKDLLMWVWGGFYIDNATITRFFTIHYLMPLLIAMMTMLHLLYLHNTGSNNPLGINKNCDKIPFNKYFIYKDLISMMILIMTIMLLTFMSPNLMTDSENYIKANSMITPLHIKPEWYFLFAYAMLRAIPNKLGGVIILLFSIMILYILPFTSKNKLSSTQFYPINKILFWLFIVTFMMLTWIGTMPMTKIYISLSQMLTTLYFSYFMMNPMLHMYWDKLLLNKIIK
uniref:Cytochrome b n=1 Tax=Acropteris iphiata TaxID=2669307 RepID=A0A7T8V7W9_9NEOP|nr:cytochrome b [Acropteris iphiata]QQQ89082.1 cytochrome b [Acropteris iphiata]